MKARLRTARDISYAHSAETRPGRMMIRLIENSTGRWRLMKRAKGYETEVAAGRSFWDVIVERYGMSLEVTHGSLDNIPKDRPVILIANHPYGMLDGMMMGYILSKARGDFKILAHHVFRKADDLKKVILPISFDETKEAVRTNIQTRKESLTYLENGGAIGIFPGGTVSTAAKPFEQPMDPGWRSFTARMVSKSNAVVVPVFFEGHNSRLFQIASHLHVTLRMGLYIKEFKKRIGTPVRVVIGEPIERDVLDALGGDSKAMMDFLREETYKLSPKPLQSDKYGFEFDEKYRT